MTARELRKHLADGHGIGLWGGDWQQMVDAHQDAHADGADHNHDDGPGRVSPVPLVAGAEATPGHVDRPSPAGQQSGSTATGGAPSGGAK